MIMSLNAMVKQKNEMDLLCIGGAIYNDRESEGQTKERDHTLYQIILQFRINNHILYGLMENKRSRFIMFNDNVK